MASKPISIEITGDASKFKKATGEVDRSLGKLGKAAVAGGLVIGAGILAGGAALFSIGSKFEEMENIIIKGTGASGDALDDLTQSMKDVLVEVPESGAVVAGALADVNTFFGSTGEELEGLTEGFLDFARVSGVEAGTAIGQVDAALTQFGLTTEDADEAMGDFLRISQATGAPMEKLLKQMETFGPIFANAGFSLEETSAIFGQLEQAGIDVTRISPALNAFFRGVADAGGDPKEALLDVQEAMLGAETEAEALSIATEAFGAEGAARMTNAVRNGSLAFDDLNALMGEGAGLVDEQADATETFSDKWNTFKNKVLVKLEPMATKLFDKLTEGMSWIENKGIPTVDRMVTKFQTFSDWVRANLDYIVAALAGLSLVIVVTLGPAFIAWAVAAASAAAATLLAMAPIVLIGIAIAALAVGIVWLWKNWDQVWNKIKAITKAVADWVVSKVSTAWGAVKGFFSDLKTKAVDTFNRMKDAVKGKASELVSSVVSTISGLPQKIKDLGWRFLNAGAAVGGKILSGIRNGLTAAVGFAGSVATGVWTKVKSAVNTNVIDKLNWAIPNSISLGYLGSISLPNNPIPRLFKGTPDFGGGVAMVGEMGRELVALPRGAQVLSNRDTEAVVGSSSGAMTVNVAVASNADPHEIARALAWTLRTNGR